jgi:hypothetical protein
VIRQLPPLREIFFPSRSGKKAVLLTRIGFENKGGKAEFLIAPIARIALIAQ